MIAKISKGGSFGGAVDYVLDKGKNAELLAGLGVRMRDNKSITRSLEMQAALNPHLSRPVGHIVLAFSAQDAARLDNRRMVGIAAEYRKYPLIPTLWMIFEDSTFAFRSGDKHRSRRIYGK